MQTNVILHQTHHQLADFSAIRKSLTNDLGGDGLHIFPELFLTGYPLQDLVLQRDSSILIKIIFSKFMSGRELYLVLVGGRW